MRNRLDVRARRGRPTRTGRGAGSAGGGGGTPFAPLDVGWAHAWWAEGPEFVALGLADTGLVTTWPDEVGTDNLIVDAGSQPASCPTYRTASTFLNNKPALRFDAVDDFVRDSWTLISQPFTIVMIARAGQTGANFYFFDGFAVSPRTLLVSQTQYQWAAPTAVNTGFTADTNAHLFTALANGASSVMELDGVAGSTISVGTNGNSGLRLNMRYNGGNLLGMDAAFLAIYAGDARTDPEWAAFEAGALSHYGLGA